MVWKCSKCGAENEDSEMFCICGAKREEPPKEPPREEPPKEPPREEPPKEPQKVLIKIINCPERSLTDTENAYDLNVFRIITVGRDPSNVLCLPDPYISRSHGRIYIEDDKVYYEDLGSTNGSYLYKAGKFEKIEGKIEINSGATLRLGTQTSIIIKY